MFNPYRNNREKDIRSPDRRHPDIEMNQLRQVLVKNKANKPLNWLKAMFLIAP